MKFKNLLLLFVSAMTFGALQAQTSDLFISEYCEWNHKATDPQTFNHYIEIYNGTGQTVDMTKYQLWRAQNGQGWNFDGVTNFDPLTLKGTLENGKTYVIARPASDNITIASDTAQTWSHLNISGDDAIGLAEDDGTGNFVLIDVIGEPDNDPGSYWPVGDSANGTMNHTLVRKASVCAPTTDWAKSAGTNAGNSEWIVHGENDTSDINQHTCDCFVETGVNSVSIVKERIYPTPSDGHFTYLSAKTQQVNVLDLTGKQVSSFKVNEGENTITLSLKPGMYFLMPQNKTKTFRLLIK
ncbi:MAG TPA: lamin tail domain-containing protein [Bacteroidales bacterium]|nr:lamin tail domain-containing protein [Bacteroidales bacterium]